MPPTIRAEELPPEALSLSPFAQAVLAGRLDVPGLLVANEREPVPMPEDRFDVEERADLAERLEARLAPLEPPVAVLDSVRALRAPGAFAVVTGQQPGFLASPLYCLYKALRAVRLARSLAQAWECPVVPLFWNHADDHDVAEVHHAHLVNEHLDLQKVGLAGMSSGRRPLSRIPLSEEAQGLSALRELLLQMLARGEHAERAVELLLPRDGDTLPSAFTRAMTGMLGHLGLVLVEPDWIRQDLSRALASIVTQDVAAHLAEGTERVRASGLEPTIDPESAALVYRVDDQGRHALRAGGDGFRYDGEPGSRTGAELAAEIVDAPESWSAGALLRPIAQDLALPVCAYVGGWAELGYQAQLPPLREACGAPTTPLVPRFSCTLLEPEVVTSLGKLEVDAAAVLAAGEDFEADHGQEPEVLAKLDRAAEEAAEKLLELRAELSELDRGLAQNLNRSAGQLKESVRKLRMKASRVHANKSGKGRRHERRAVTALAPRGELQERVLGPLPFLASYGLELVDALFEHVGPYDARHVLATIEVPE
jgi:bacillithiol biosynthesis cysteine-adding enzyme BshC